jgi:hypothetical protein
MTEMTMTAPAERGDWGRRAAVTAPLVSVFAIGAGAPLYADDLADAAATGRFALAATTSLIVLLLLVPALLALHARQAPAYGRLGHAGFGIALLGTVLAAGGAWDSAFAVPFLADEAPAALDAGSSGSLLAGYLISYLAFAAGWALFAVATLRARMLSRAGAIVVLVGAVFAILPSPTAIRVLPIAIGAALLVTRPAPRGRAQA